MPKKLPFSKKQLVVAGVTSAGLLLSPTVFADEASAPSTLASPSAPASQVSPTPETGLAVTTATSVSADVNASTNSSESSEIVSSEAVSTYVSTSQAVPTVTAQAVPTVSSLASASQVVHDRVVARVAVSAKAIQEKVTKTVTGGVLSLQYNGPIASNSRVQYAVWGDVAGRNDLIWYTANNLGAAYIDLSKHREYGLYHVHTYQNISGKMVGVEGGSITIPRPVITPKITKVASDYYVVRLEGVSESLSQVKVPVWSVQDGQDDLKWYSTNQVSAGVYEAHIYTANHHNNYGKYNVHVYAHSAITGGLLGIASTSFIREHSRTFSPATVVISHKTATTATITVAGSVDSKLITRVSVAAWSRSGGQDDLKWYSTEVLHQRAQVTVDMRDLSNTTDDYTIHVYTDYADGSRVGTNLGEHRFTKPSEIIQGGQVTITAVDLANNCFQTVISNASSSEGLKGVRVAVWSDVNGQDDLEWQVARKQLDGSYVATTDLARHAYVNGVYHVHVYYRLASGRLLGISANKLKVEGVKSKVYPMPYFNQRDPQWVSKYYGRYTMGDTGCVPTSLSMVFSALTGKTVMPTTVADWLYYHTNEFDRKVPGTRAPGIVKVANAWGLKATNLSSYNHIVSALRDGHYVVAGVQNNVFVAHTSHEIVLKGYQNGMVYVTDPYTKSLSGWYAMAYLFNTKSTDRDDTALGLPFFKISHV